MENNKSKDDRVTDVHDVGDEPATKKARVDTGQEDTTVTNGVQKDASSMDTTKTATAAAVEDKTSTDEAPARMQNSDVDCGIEAFVSDLQGFRAIVKQRYSDFIVNEIALDGTVVHLTDVTTKESKGRKNDEQEKEEADLAKAKRQNTTEPKSEALENTTTPSSAIATPTMTIAMTATTTTTPASVAKGVEAVPDTTPPTFVPSSEFLQFQTDNGKEIAEKVKALAGGGDKKSIIGIPCETLTKPARTMIHKTMKAQFDGKLLTRFNATTKCIDVTWGGAGKTDSRVSRDWEPQVNKDDFKRSKDLWPDGAGDYCEFTLYKENKGTMDAVEVIRRFLQIKTKRFGYAGTKDTRAVTCQRMSVHRVPAGRLGGLNKRLIGIKLGNFTYSENALKLGDLSGNRFHIVLRNVNCDEALAKKAMESLGSTGFINYFGMQRFGTTQISTSSIGRAILASDWGRVIDLILGPRVGDMKDIARARKTWFDTRDAKKALKAFPYKCTMERQLLEGISKHGVRNLIAAVSSIARNMRLLYVHAYQSLVWNKMVSARLQKFGMKPIVGDLVIAKETDTGKIYSGDDERKVALLVLTEADLSRYTIHDIVLPLPGYAVIYPNNGMRKFYEECLKNDGLGLDPASFRHKQKDYALSGAYRHLVILPKHIEWNCERYDDYTKSLWKSDFETINEKSAASTNQVGTTSEAGNPEEKQQLEGARKRMKSDGVADENTESEAVTDTTADVPKKYMALKLAFNLPTSSYATMLIRELTKLPTDIHYMTSLNTHK